MRRQPDSAQKKTGFLRSLTGSVGDGMNFVDLLPPHELLGHIFPLSAPPDVRLVLSIGEIGLLIIAW
jgi:hypothetical protein